MSEKEIDKKSEEYFEKHMHDGHRQRLLSTVSEVGLDHLSDIQVLEFVLFYIFPRGDVNPLAHRLLEKFMDVSSVLDAGYSDLMDVKGMGSASAKKLVALSKIFNYYILNRVESKGNINNLEEFLRDCYKLFVNRKEESCYCFGVDILGRVLKGRLLATGTNANANFNVGQLNNYLDTYKPTRLIVMHNHPKGTCMPSTQDFETFMRIDKFLSFYGCDFMDSYIFADDGVFSCKYNQKIPY